MSDLKCPGCGTTDPRDFHEWEGVIDSSLCIDCSVDKWESERPEREQRERERLDYEGYYD